MAFSLATQQNSPSKITASPTKSKIAIRPSRQLFEGQLNQLKRKLSTSNSVNLVADQAMSAEDLELLEDFGFDTQLKQNTRKSLNSLLISKQKLKLLSQILAKEPHEKTNREVEELRKMISEIEFLKNYITKDEAKLSMHDYNDLSKLLLYERLQAGEEIQLFGEKSHQMYIILKGKVALARPNTKQKSIPLDQLNIEGTFQTQIKRQGTKRAKQAKGQTQVVENQIKSSQIMYNGIPCRFLVTVEVADENGKIQKIKKPHPIYQEFAEMQKVLDNLKTQTLETPAYREKLDQTIQLKSNITESERAFQFKLEQTMTARRQREANLHTEFQPQNTLQVHQHTHDSHLHAHQLHMQRIQQEQDQIEQIVFHNKPTIISIKEKYKTMRSGAQSRHSDNNSIVSSIQKSKEIDELEIQKHSIAEFGGAVHTGQSVALAIPDVDPLFDTDEELSDNELPIDCDEQDFPTEEIFDYLEAGQYFGQLSLSENSSAKRASVYTKTTTHLLIIEKLAFQKMLSLHQKRHEAELLTFLKTIPLFKTFPNSLLKRLVCFFNPVKKILNSYLYRENEPSTHVYIVKEGEFRCTRRVIKDQTAQRNEPKPIEVYEDPRKSMKGQSKFFIKNIVNQYETVELQNLGKFQVIGDEDCALSNKYNTTVQCISQEAKLIAISREDFRKIELNAAQWALVLKNGEEKIRRYHEKMRQFKFVKYHVEDEISKINSTSLGVKEGGKKFIAGEDLLKQHRDSVKRPSGELVENPVFQSRRIEVDLEKLIDRQVPQHILSTKQESRFSNLRKNYVPAFSTAQIAEQQSNIQLLEEKTHERKISTAMPNTRRPPLQAKLVNNLHKTNAVSQVFDKYQTPNLQSLHQLGVSQKVARNSRGFSTADTVPSLNTRKLQTTAYLKLRENNKTRSQGVQSQTGNRNIKYSISWNLSPTQNQPQVRSPIDLNNII